MNGHAYLENRVLKISNGMIFAVCVKYNKPKSAKIDLRFGYRFYL